MRQENDVLRDITRPHIEAYDKFIQYGLREIASNIDPVTVPLGPGRHLTFSLEEVRAGQTVLAGLAKSVSPKTCREGRQTYSAPLAISISWSLNDGERTVSPMFDLCDIPVMVGSCLCKLGRAGVNELVSYGEEANELGGYFIVGGIERVIRLLIQQRRHYVMGLVRSSFRSRGSLFSKYATAIRCVDNCERSSTVKLHYLLDGSVSVGLAMSRKEIFLPVALVIRALTDISEHEVHQLVLQGVLAGGKVEAGYAQETLEKIFDSTSQNVVRTRTEAIEHIGSLFLTTYEGVTPDTFSTGEHMLRSCLFIHLKTNGSKLDLLIFMLNKLLSLVSGSCKEDDPDSLVHQEVLLPGFLLQTMLHEKLYEGMLRVKSDLENVVKLHSNDSIDMIEHLFVSAMKRIDIGKQLEYFLATGNLVSKSGLGLTQTSGFTIVAEKLNYLRYISHFQSVHRGAYFAELRTTTVRKLLPESWGFICPVHTPDGSPCGLLTHVSASTKIALGDKSIDSVVLTALITEAISTRSPLLLLNDSVNQQVIPVLLDGCIIGYIPTENLWKVAAKLRNLKVSSKSAIPSDIEIAVLPDSEVSSAYPCLVLFTGSSRLLRPVRNLNMGSLELIGTMEQNSIRIGLCSDTVCSHDAFSHCEISPGQMLSIVASLTPWSDFNQSPRNMYQCQMAKQTMGVPLHSFIFRSDTKLYRLHSPQRPIALTSAYDKFAVDSYPLGTNTVVAVLSHTGYDMEDAMIINKAAVERGFAHATLYKTEPLLLRANERFQGNEGDVKCGSITSVHSDGLPHIGQRLKASSIVYRSFDAVSNSYREVKQKATDDSFVDKIKRVSTTGKGSDAEEANVTLRFNRNPIIGDKFSSRHGQKGVLSFLWPDESLPYIERTGIRPDILINPHAFPSRMTIGMLVESLASKGGALLGKSVDASAFCHSKCSPIDTNGALLSELGYNRTGSETMINGHTGEIFNVDIYIGLVYYQRLRHMVNDKFQVRSTGPVNPVTKQPIKGRKAGGGVRFGEMERDSLLAHGAAYLLRDRLHLSSDTHISSVCTSCGSLISTFSRALATGTQAVATNTIQCQVCKTSCCIETVALPFVFKYLAAELAAMNIQMKVSLT